ncbi:MAG: HAD hydrolase family protein, partial [Candidatus Omnitrophica bacterium]|nr:HAD hydrolase family protein [Candidatus Omnitrophota bacterium]
DPEKLGTDSKTNLPYVASCDIQNKEVYLHVIDFFGQLPTKQLEILYHELISHLVKKITNEDTAMLDTFVGEEKREQIKGVVVGIGDSGGDLPFLSLKIESPYLAFYVGENLDVAKYPSIIPAKGGVTKTGEILKLLSDSHNKETNQQFFDRLKNIGINVSMPENLNPNDSFKVSVIYADKDGTLAKTREPIDDNMANIISELLSKGIRFVVVTSNRTEEVKKNFVREILNKIKAQSNLSKESNYFIEEYLPSKFSFTPHITIGYIARTLDNQEFWQLVGKILEINYELLENPIKITIKPGQLMEFPNMDSFRPISSSPLVRAAFIGFDTVISQRNADRKCKNSKKRGFSANAITELLPLIDKISFGKDACNNAVVKRLIKEALERIRRNKIIFKISTKTFGRFANMLTHKDGKTIVYLDKMFEEIFRIVLKRNILTLRLTKELKLKLALFFAILVHESYHKSRPVRGKMPLFGEEMLAGLKEFEIYILMGNALRKEILSFIKDKFGQNSNIYIFAEKIFKLADEFDKEINTNAFEYYYEPRYIGRRFEQSYFTAKGKGEFAGEVFLALRGEEIIPDGLKSFYYYLIEEAGKGNITLNEVGLIILSITENLTLKGYDEDLKKKLNIELRDEKYWPLLLESYRKEIEFGTAGIRGRRGLEKDVDGDEVLFIPGTNVINIDVIRRYTLGVVGYIKNKRWQRDGVVLGFDVRKGSKELACEALEILLKYGIKVYYFDQPRPISEMALAVLHYRACGYLYFTASHNPKTDTGVKLGNELGAQLFGSQRKEILKEITSVDISMVEGTKNLKTKKDKLRVVTEEFDKVFIEKIKKHLLLPNIQKTLRVLYDPLYGSGLSVLPKLLEELGYQYSLYTPHCEFNGNFPDLIDKEGKPLNPDPADKRVLRYAIEYAKGDFDVIVATDPDSDRCGIAIRDLEGNWQVLSANDVWALLIYFRMQLLKDLREKNMLNKEYQNLLNEGYSVISWVTSDLLEVISRDFGLHIRRPAVGFNKIAEVALDEIILPKILAEQGLCLTDTYKAKYKGNLRALARELNLSINLVLFKVSSFGQQTLFGGFEESNGVSLGGHILEKDGTLAAVVMLEVFEYAKLQGLTLYEAFIKMWREFGYYATVNIPLSLSGPTAMKDKDRILHIAEDYYRLVKEGKKVNLGGKEVKEAHRGEDLAGFKEPGFKFIFEDGSWLIIRPSGTEAKIRFYGQSVVDKREFEALTSNELLAIKKIEDEKLEDFVRVVMKQFQEQIKQNAFGEVNNVASSSILLFDIDGTIAERKRPLSKEMAEILNSLMNKGIKVVIVTGNPLDIELRERLKQIWNNPNLILSINSATQLFYFEEYKGKIALRELIKYRKGIDIEDKAKLKELIT